MKKDAKKAVTKDEIERFQKEQQGLEVELLDEILQSRRKAWIVAGTSFVFGAIALGLAGFVTYRYSQPVPAHMVVLGPDRAIEQVSLMTPQSSYGEVNDTYWVSSFVRHFEGYDFNTVQADYDAVGLMAGGEVAEQYQKRYKWGTRDAFDKTIGDSKSVRVSISSVILDREHGIATVRFSTSEKYRTRPGAEPPQYWIATLAYSYDNGLLKASERYINPLGFRVSSYRVNSEAPANVGG
ncbi:VirB8 family type IV secretion system protein [Pseudomonas aeruginosa]